MKKILLAFDGSAYAEGALSYAFRLGNKQEDLIVGVFIEDLSYLSYVTVFGEEYLPMDYELINQMKSESATKIKENITRFEQACKKKGWKYDVHYNKGVPAYELVQESLYADLIIIGYQTFFSDVESLTGNDLLKDILPDAECPVIAVPEDQKKPEHIILANDGKPASMFAIKQFAYLFPALRTSYRTTSLTVTASKEEGIASEKLVRQYLELQFGKPTFKQIYGEPDEAILNFAQGVDNPLLVMGAYGRNVFSRFFVESVAEKIIKQQNLPIFVAHK